MVGDIRTKFPGTKLIINELLPRKDSRNDEARKLNQLLRRFETSNADITVAYQDNISDMNMFYDAKHLHESKVPVYAKNIIKGLLRGYGISDKKELFVPSTDDHRNKESRRPSTTTTDIGHRLKQHANYGDMNEGIRERGWQ